MVKQVGGTHYEGMVYEIWDFVADVNLNFYSANALKYLLRNKGNRLEDLNKALSYVKKLKEIKKEKPEKYRKIKFINYDDDHVSYHTFISLNKLVDDSILEQAVFYICEGSLKYAKHLIKELIKAEEESNAEFERADNGSLDFFIIDDPWNKESAANTAFADTLQALSSEGRLLVGEFNVPTQYEVNHKFFCDGCDRCKPC